MLGRRGRLLLTCRCHAGGLLKWWGGCGCWTENRECFGALLMFLEEMVYLPWWEISSCKSRWPCWRHECDLALVVGTVFRQELTDTWVPLLGVRSYIGTGWLTGPLHCSIPSILQYTMEKKYLWLKKEEEYPRSRLGILVFTGLWLCSKVTEIEALVAGMCALRTDGQQGG